MGYLLIPTLLGFPVAGSKVMSWTKRMPSTAVCWENAVVAACRGTSLLPAGRGRGCFCGFHRVNDEYRLRTLKRGNDENWLVMIYMGGLWWLACTWCILKCATDHCAVGNPTPKQACPQHISWPHILVPPALFLLLLVSLPPFRVLSLLVTTTTSDDRHYNFATLLKSIACFMLLRSLEHT